MSEEFDCFMQLYSGLLREGPGDAESLSLALQGLPAGARIFDAACGSGADTGLMLDTLPQAEILAVDRQQQFIYAANSRGLPADFQVGDMLKPCGKFDLIWSAGAVYFVGVEAALAAWRPHLKNSGRIGFSEVVWLTDTPHKAAQDFWNDAFPAMGNIAEMSARIEAKGFRVISSRPLGRGAWLGYYASLAARIADIRLNAPSKMMQQVIAETESEMVLFEAHFGDYDYVVFIIEPA